MPTFALPRRAAVTRPSAPRIPALVRPRSWPDALAAGAFVAGPLAMLSFHALNERYLPRDDARLYLEQIASLGNRFPAATIAYLAAAMLNLVIGLAIIRLLGRRPAGIVAGGFTMLAAIGSTGFAAMNLFLWALVDELGVTADLVRGYAAFQDSIGFLLLAAITLPAAIIASVALLTGLLRSRVAPLWVPAVIVAGFVAGSGEFGRAGNIAGGALGVVAGVGLALAYLTAHHRHP